MSELHKPIKADWEELLVNGRIESLKWKDGNLVGFKVVNGFHEKDIFISGTIGLEDDKDSGKFTEPVGDDDGN